MKRRAQATRANPAQVDLHLLRQRKLGERMIGDNDRPRAIELAVTAILVVIVICALYFTGI